MTLHKLSQISRGSGIKALSAFNGRVLCHNYSSEKHEHLKDREVIDIWADMEIVKSVFGNWSRPRLCVYLSGGVEANLYFESKKIAEGEL